jgi:hypothetical protein
MKLFNMIVPKDSISMIFDSLGDVENYNTTLLLYKSKIELAEEDNEFSKHIVLDLDKKIKNEKIMKFMCNQKYGTFLLDFLNADFSTSESAYNTFFVYYGIEGIEGWDDVKRKYPIDYSTRYVSTKKFLDYYHKAYDYVSMDYIKYQNDLRKTVDFVFDLHGYKSTKNIDKYSKFMAYSSAINLTGQFFSQIRLGMVRSLDKELPTEMNSKQLEKLALDIANKKIRDIIAYVYDSTSFFGLTYVALNDLIQHTKRNISVCQNCGRYYLQYSGKEIYCELPNQDGSPTCKSYASRKAYDIKIVEDTAELAYKREYQRRMTKVYRANDITKPVMRMEFDSWKDKARKQLKLYRENKITADELCKWLDENK